MSSLRSLRYKIAFVFFLVTAAAFTVIWFGVVPQLEQNLKEERLTNLRDEIRSTRPALELPTVGGRQPSAKQFADRIGTAEDATNARVTVRDWQRQTLGRTATRASNPWTTAEEPGPFDEDLARRALMSRHVLRAYGTSATSRSA